MPRIRSIKPDFFTSEQIVSVSIPARYLFEGIWVFGDDDGYIAHSPIQMKMRIFPGDSVEVPELIAELLGAGLVRIVQTDQGEALWVPSFRNHQSPKYPTPTKYTLDGQSLTQRSPSAGGKVPKSSPSTHPGEERRGEERREKKNTAHPSDSPSTKKLDEMFDAFWQAWPVKKGKEPARKSFIKAIKSGADMAAIMAGVEAYKVELGSLMGGKTIDGRTPKYAQGWLTDKRWEDEPTTASVADINAQWDAAMGETKNPCANGHKWAADDSCVRCLQLKNDNDERRR